MKPFSVLLFLIPVLVFVACDPSDSDPCDQAHIIINGECVPDYIFPPKEILKNGEKYFHQKYGVITFKNSHWFDENDEIIEDLEIKAEQ